jgi:hypothetical protein
MLLFSYILRTPSFNAESSFDFLVISSTTHLVISQVTPFPKPEDHGSLSSASSATVDHPVPVDRPFGTIVIMVSSMFDVLMPCMGHL